MRRVSKSGRGRLASQASAPASSECDRQRRETLQMATGLDRELIRPTARVQPGRVVVSPRAMSAMARFAVKGCDAAVFAFQEHRVALRIVLAQLIVSLVLCNAANRPVI